MCFTFETTSKQQRRKEGTKIAIIISIEFRWKGRSNEDALSEKRTVAMNKSATTELW